MHHEQPSLSDSHRSHDAHPPSLVLETSPQDKSSQQQPQTKTRERLKRPPNAYLLFNRDMRRKLLEISPKMTVAEISKEIGERWKELSKDQRQSYIDQAALIKQDHLQTHPNFIYTRRSKAEIAEARNLSKSRRCMKSTTTHCRRRRQQDAKDITRDPRGRKKKRHKHPTAPKHPMSGFLFYLSAVRPQIAQRFPGSTVGPISKIIARQWRNMSNQERIPWLEKAEQDKARYAQEMQIYMGTLGEQREDASQAAVQVIDAPGHFQEPQ
ncbi:high mobility group box domain-containing protein [Dichotomocladium elegans]|nr:high mobility group box domain-containing protein [Dichotomocladium elegans]